MERLPLDSGDRARAVRLPCSGKGQGRGHWRRGGLTARRGRSTETHPRGVLRRRRPRGTPGRALPAGGGGAGVDGLVQQRHPGPADEPAGLGAGVPGAHGAFLWRRQFKPLLSASSLGHKRPWGCVPAPSTTLARRGADLPDRRRWWFFLRRRGWWWRRGWRGWGWGWGRRARSRYMTSDRR